MLELLLWGQDAVICWVRSSLKGSYCLAVSDRGFIVPCSGVSLDVDKGAGPSFSSQLFIECLLVSGTMYYTRGIEGNKRVSILLGLTI